jgi:predicted helicase
MSPVDDKLPISPKNTDNLILDLLIDCKMLAMTNSYMSAFIWSKLENIEPQQAYKKIEKLNDTMRRHILTNIAEEHGDITKMYPSIDFEKL